MSLFFLPCACPSCLLGGGGLIGYWWCRKRFPAYLLHFFADAVLVGLSRPDPPGFFPPPVILFTVDHARCFASFSDTPRFSYPTSMLLAWRYCFSVYLDLSPLGIISLLIQDWGPQNTRPIATVAWFQGYMFFPKFHEYEVWESYCFFSCPTSKSFSINRREWKSLAWSETIGRVGLALAHGLWFSHGWIFCGLALHFRIQLSADHDDKCG